MSEALFAIDPSGSAELENRIQQNTREVPIDPPWWKGVAAATGMGIMRGGAKAADTIETAAKKLSEFQTGLPVSQVGEQSQEERRKAANDYWTPDAKDTGTAGRILGGLGEAALPLMVTGGNPALLVGSEVTQTRKDLLEQGVAPETATTAALVQGLGTAAGFRIPFLGKTLASRVVSGAVGNEAVSTATTAATHQILSESPKAAAQYDVTDPESHILNTIMGGAFGTVAHLLSPSVGDAALTARNAKHFQESAPGVPADLESSAKHQASVEQAIDQLAHGEPVEVGDTIRGAVMHEKPLDDVANQAVAKAIKEDSVASAATDDESGYSVSEGDLTDEQIQAFESLRSELRADENVGATGEGVSGESRPQNDGGSGADTGRTVYRGSATELVPEHFANDALGHATGHPSSGLGVFFTNDRVDAAHYGNVSEHQLDLKNPKVIPADELPAFDTLGNATQFREQLRAKGHDGIVIDASHLGGPVQFVAFDAHQVKPAKPKPAETKKASLPPSIESKAAQDAAARAPNAMIVDGYDADNNPQYKTVSQALAEVEAEHATAKKEAKAYDAAVTCFFNRG